MGCCRVDYVGITSVELAPGILWHRDELEVLNLPNVEACLVGGEALGLMDMTVCLLASSLQLLAIEKGLQVTKDVLKFNFVQYTIFYTFYLWLVSVVHRQLSQILK
jgi:hypothetical protein